MVTMKSMTAIIALAAIALAAGEGQGQERAAGTRTPAQANATQNEGYSSYLGYISDHSGPATREDQDPIGFVGYVQPASAVSQMLGAVDAGKTKGGFDSGKACDDSRRRVLCDPWVTFEYMHTWARGRYLPALVTTSPPGVNGRLPLARVLFGDGYVGTDLQGAGKISFGTWLDPQHRIGVGGKFFAIEGDSVGFIGASDANGNPLLARPFFNTDPIVNAQDSLIVTGIGLRSGDIRAIADNDVLGAEAYLRFMVYNSGNRRIDLLAGYQFARVDDSLTISHRMTQIGGLFPPGTTFAFEDVFDVQNEFHGAELGLLSELDRGPFTLSTMAKLGFGNMRQTLTISGSSSVNGVASSPNGGLLAQPTNIGVYRRDDFEIIPEVEVKLICRFNRRLEGFIGYSLMYWSGIAQAAQHIDVSQQNTPTVNGSQLLGGALVGPSNPQFPGIRDTDFWLQGLTLGVTLRL